MAEGARLENVSTLTRIVSSNLTLSDLSIEAQLSSFFAIRTCVPGRIQAPAFSSRIFVSL